MKKSNSKDLYKLAKRLKAKQNIPAPDDSLEIVLAEPPKKKPSHFRSQSCPFNGELDQDKHKHLRQRQSNNFYAASASGHKKKPSHQSSTSQPSMSSQTVIIRQLPMQQLSTVLYRKHGKGHKELLKKSMAGFKNENYTRTRVSQQIRTYQLRNQLDNIQRSSENTSIKQRILQTLLLRCESDILQHSFEFA